MSWRNLHFSIPVSILSYLHVDLRSKLHFLKIIFNLGAFEMK